MIVQGSSVARLETALDRIADPALQGNIVFTQTFPATARAEAVGSDVRSTTGQGLGPMDGRIVSVKALLDIAGEVTSAGSKILRGQPAAKADAVAVTRLREAGAVVVGRTHMTEFAFSAVGVNPHDGSPGNPADRSRISGGSSTGAAISVAAGMAEIAIGSDTGGSIRIPAALCGVVGFKGSIGKASTEGVFPLSPTLDVIGPLARSVADCAMTQAILSGTKAEMLPEVAPTSIALTFLRGRLSDDVEPDVKAAMDEAAGRLTAKGVSVSEGSIEAELDQMAALDKIGIFPAVELLTTLREMGIDDLGSVDPRTVARIEGGQGLSAVDYIRMHRARARLIAMMTARLSSGEILALPTLPITAVPIDSVEEPAAFHRVNSRLLRNTRVANLFDLPAISLPIRSSGLPVGLMLMARQGDDRRLLTIAAAIEKALAD
jgi:aspartyl-tRNA(Asn)/glutamyl-tRNA(Gln) amidotransferase subunit A